MAITKPSEKVANQRLDQLSFLKSRLGRQRDMNALKGSVGWNAFKGLIEDQIKFQENRRTSLLLQETFEQSNHVQSIVCESVISICKAMIDVVEKGEDSEAYIRTQIQDLENTKTAVEA